MDTRITNDCVTWPGTVPNFGKKKRPGICGKQRRSTLATTTLHAMSEPTTREEYEAKTTANTTYFGRGLETGMNLPCPFCAEPGFMSYRIMDCYEALMKGGICKHCGRGMRGIMLITHGLTRIQFVQHAGPPVTAAWLPKFQRVEQ